MVRAQLVVSHSHCALCGNEQRLFVLSLKAGEPMRLEPIGETTHAGICLPCWLRGTRAIKEDVLRHARLPK